MVALLPQELQRRVYENLKKALKQLGLSGDELRKAIQDGMDSKIIDLSDTIDIKKLGVKL